MQKLTNVDLWTEFTNLRLLRIFSYIIRDFVVRSNFFSQHITWKDYIIADLLSRQKAQKIEVRVLGNTIPFELQGSWNQQLTITHKGNFGLKATKKRAKQLGFHIYNWYVQDYVSNYQHYRGKLRRAPFEPIKGVPELAPNILLGMKVIRP